MHLNTTSLPSASLPSLDPLLEGAFIAFGITISFVCFLILFTFACMKGRPLFFETTAWRMWREVHGPVDEEGVPMMDVRYGRGGGGMF